jgi:DNA-binding transcriptional ArsR family regulator
VLRIHFTARDLSRVRIAAAPDPLWELSLSMHVLRLRNSEPWLAEWKSGLLRLLEPHHELRREVALPLALNPPLGYFPDFLTPAEGLRGFETGLDAVLSTPHRRIRREMAAFGTAHPSLGRLAAGVGTATADRMQDLERGMRRYHEIALRPIWDRVRSAVDADRALRARCLSDSGVGALLDTLNSAAVFRDGVLEISSYIATRDLYLDGRGLLLVPSYFKRGDKPMVLADPQLTPVLIYPMSRDVRIAVERRTVQLSTLLGRTRATVLELAADGTTTGGMAVSLGVSAAAVSQHIGVLRKGGLVVSVRDRNRVHHGLTPLGQALLDGNTHSGTP